jgi:hypothetical protein
MKSAKLVAPRGESVLLGGGGEIGRGRFRAGSGKVARKNRTNVCDANWQKNSPVLS